MTDREIQRKKMKRMMNIETKRQKIRRSTKRENEKSRERISIAERERERQRERETVRKRE